MPRATTNKLYRTFVKGMITEAGPLTYPENATINEDNMVVFQAGNRQRRLGLDFETNHELSTFGRPKASFNDMAINNDVWWSADNNDQWNFLVTQFGETVHFYDMSKEPLSSGLQQFQINLNDFTVNSLDPSIYECQFAVGKGYLFIVNKACDPILVQFDSVNQAFSTQKIHIQVRDFKGVDDGLANDQEPTTLSNLHQYNLMNQGWIDPSNDASGSSVTYYTNFGDMNTYNQAPTTATISAYFTQFNRYPGNNKQWWVAKNGTTGAFDPSLLANFFYGNARAPRGHYVVSAFNKDRSAVSGVTGIPIESETYRPRCVSFFSGRVWYGFNSTIYFSQILDDKSKAGFCYQEADPTSEEISDLIATDGGEIPIPEMIDVQRIVPLGGGMMCFARNGVWFIGGPIGAGFSALDMTVTKVNPIGTTSPNSIVAVQSGQIVSILWWSEDGIQALQQMYGTFGPMDNRFNSTIITLTTIQTFFNNIPKSSLPYVRANYDPSSHLVQWVFNDGTAPYNHTYNRALNYDLVLEAFYPWTFSHEDSVTGPWVCGIFKPINPLLGQKNSYTKYLVTKGIDPSFYFTFGEMNNTNHADWNSTAYTSFMETGYELLEDAMRQKQAMYVFTYFRRTEQNWIPSGTDYTVDKPSSCYLQIKWDWSDTSFSNRWSTKQQAYRIQRVAPVDPNNPVYNSGYPVVVTRNKVRGHGKAIQFRFENGDIGSDFDLLGWSVPYSGNTEP